MRMAHGLYVRTALEIGNIAHYMSVNETLTVLRYVTFVQPVYLLPHRI